MKYEYGYLVDNVWHCGCGSLNAATLKTCPECNMSRDVDIDKKYE